MSAWSRWPLLVVIASTATSLAQPVAAQERPGPAAEFAAGTLLFADDGIVSEGFVGGAGRVYVLPRVSVGPEIAYIQGQNHSHLILTGNVTFDLVRPSNGKSRPVTPFVVGGGGLFRTREPFPGNEIYTSSEGAFTAGGGVRGLVGAHMIVGAEARIGWETHIRLNGIVGVRFGR
jgi:hypothetical protein